MTQTKKHTTKPATKRLPAKTEADRSIEKRPFFAHWENRGGKRTAIFKPVVSSYVAKAIEEDDSDLQRDLSLAFAAGTQIYDPESKKTVRPTRWWIEYAEGRSDAIDVFYRKSAWAYRCVEIRSQAMGQVPYQIVDANEEEVEESALGALLEEVNPECNWGELIGYTEADLDIYGNAYWLKLRNKNMQIGDGKGGPVFLQRLSPKAVEPVIGPNGIEKFKYSPQGQAREIPRSDVVYFHTYNPDSQLIGLSPLEVCKKAMQVEAAADEHMYAFFENHAMPQFIMSAPTQDQNELNRLSAAWKQMYGKNKSVGGTAFVGGGAEPKEMGYAPDKLALKDVREEARKAICAALGVPPVLVGAWEAANYATANEQRSSLYTETIIPRGEYIASVINAELAPELGDDKFEWEWDQLDVMQEDETAKATRVALLVEKQIIKPEIAAEEMGYDATDVPEPKPIPEALKPFTEGKEPKDEELSEEAELEEELAKWRKKAVKRLKDGKPAAIVFRSEIIPNNLLEFILGQLETVDSIKGVDAVFAKAKSWGSYP